MWEKVVLNLLSNAFKFTCEGEIARRASRRGGRASSSTVARHRHRHPRGTSCRTLFERFHRVEGARGRTHEGTGIGLALVQELVAAARRHGRGRERARARAARSPSRSRSGRRTCPPSGWSRTRAADVDRRSRRRAVRRGGAALAAAGDEADAEPVAARTPARSRPGRPRRRRTRPRVLLADDNADMRDYVRRLLAGRYDVERRAATARRRWRRRAASRPIWCSPT